MSENLSSLESSVRHGYAQVGDVRLHYAESGAGARLVVLLHGFPECWYSWRHQLAALGERFRAVAQSPPEYVWKLPALQVPPPAVWAKNVTLKQLLRSWYMFFFQLPVLPEWFVRRDDFAAVEKAFRTTARPGTFTDTDIAIFKSALRQPGAVNGGINYYRANFAARLRRAWERKPYAREELIRVPTLFVYGEQDMAIVPETVQGVGDYIDAPYNE